MRRACRVVLACLTFLLTPALGAEAPARVYAASSLTDAFGAIAHAWRERGHPVPVLVFGGSATLARQLAAGAPADLFMSADPRWMQQLADEGYIQPGSRVDLLANTLVVIAPRGAAFRAEMRSGFPFAEAFRGKLCMGEPEVVPAGSYAREALRALGFWDSLQGRIVVTEDVRTALTFVERGECAAGIVYATDARISRKVEVVAGIPAFTHRPIVYPMALLRDARPEARVFFDYLRDSPEAHAVFERHGFTLVVGAH